MADAEIMRPTLPDHAPADPNFDRARREAEMVGLRRRLAVTALEPTGDLIEITGPSFADLSFGVSGSSLNVGYGAGGVIAPRLGATMTLYARDFLVV